MSPTAITVLPEPGGATSTPDSCRASIDGAFLVCRQAPSEAGARSRHLDAIVPDDQRDADLVELVAHAVEAPARQQ